VLFHAQPQPPSALTSIPNFAACFPQQAPSPAAGGADSHPHAETSAFEPRMPTGAGVQQATVLSEMVFPSFTCDLDIVIVSPSVLGKFRKPHRVLATTDGTVGERTQLFFRPVPRKIFASFLGFSRLYQ